MRWFTHLLLTTLLAGTAQEFRDHIVSYGQTEERVAGLLDVPEILGDFGCKELEIKRVALYSAPSRERPSIGAIETRPSRSADEPDCYLPKVVVRRTGSASDEVLPTDEIGYENPAAVVYQRSGTWFRIALQTGSAWIEREGSFNFLPYPAGLIGDQHLTYLRQDWDGMLWTVPGAASAMAPKGWLAHRARSLPVRLLSTRTVGRETWIQIRFETEEVCGRTLDGVTPLEGWIPAYRQNATSVWFSSRGC